MAAFWDTGEWDVDRWPTLAIADLLQQKPNVDGALIGAGDWRLHVEILLPESHLSIWGIGEWDTATWNRWAWTDITSFVRGLEWSRGSDEPHGRPRIGELAVTLDETGIWSPWNADLFGSSAFFAPGTIIRVGIRSNTDSRAGSWIPQFCGKVDDWGQTFVQASTDNYITITAHETLRDLAGVDANALSGSVGGSDEPIERLQRLLDAADWPYGFLVTANNIIEHPEWYPLQSTDMAANRLAELYLTADSSDVRFRTHRSGAAYAEHMLFWALGDDPDTSIIPLSDFSYDTVVGPPRVGEVGFDWYTRDGYDGHGTFKYLGYDPDSFQTSNNDEHIVNDARFARVGGTQQVHELPMSINRYGRRTLSRNDLITSSNATTRELAQWSAERRGRNTLRVSSLTCHLSDMDADSYLTGLAADVGDFAWCYSPDGSTEPTGRPRIFGLLASVKHSVTPLHEGGLNWTATYSIDTREVFNLPGANLFEIA